MRTSFHALAIAAYLWLAMFSGEASAQTDAEIALQNARTAFANEQYETARDLLQAASQTDADNPDVFLLLGKASYQLGDVDAAIAAWRRTLALAPAQAYAKRMVESLQGMIQDVDVRLDVIESFLQEHLPSLANLEIRSLKTEALTGDQLIRLLKLEAESLIDLGQEEQSLKPLRELAVRDPDQAATVRVRLLSGRAKLALDIESITEGLEILAAVKTEFADTAEAAAADLALISFRIDQGEDALEELAAWISNNQQHTDLHDARQTMLRAVTVFLQEAAREPAPGKDHELTEAERSAQMAAVYAFPALKHAGQSMKLAEELVAYVHSRLIAGRSYAAANAMLERLLQTELPDSSRAVFETALNRSKDAAATEELTEILVALAVGDGSPDSLAGWIATHTKHPQLIDARRQLVTAYLDQTRAQGTPDAESEMSDADQAAIAAAGSLLGLLETAPDKSAVIAQVLAHLKSHYSEHRAHAAAIAGHGSLLELSLPSQVRLAVLNGLADAQTEAAISRLGSEVSAGNLKSGPLPPDLVALLKTLETINGEFPSKPSWAKQVAVGARIDGLGQRVEWPARVTQLKATDDWALEFVLPVIVSDRDPKSTGAAVKVVNSIVERATAVGQKSARGLASRTVQRLLDVLPEESGHWPPTVLWQLRLRIADDSAVFQENASAGRVQLNSQFSADQKAIFALASKLVARQPSSAADVLSTLQPFVTLRTAAGYDAVVEEAYNLLEASLPPPQLRAVRLAIAQSWVNQVISQHARLLQSGFQPPEELDPQLEKALVRFYQLTSELEPGHEFVKAVQGVRSTVITHYRNLQYYDAAAAAIRVKAEQGVDWLDASADFELASLRLSVALEELDRQTGQFQGRENMTLTPAVKEAIAAFEQFINGRPTDPLVAQAVAKIMSVGRAYERYEKYDVAAEVYTGLEAFASASETLQQAKPNTPTVAEQAALAGALAMHVKAGKTLAETIQSLAEGDDPPSELSVEFQAAVAAYQAILQKYADSPLANAAISKMLEIALQHAAVGAWDVADGVYANLQQQELPLRQPERLDLARALCEMGKVIPQHAQQVLAAITLWERDVRRADDPFSQIAMGPMVDGQGMMGGSFGGGGFGGMAGMGGMGMGESEEEMMQMGVSGAIAATAVPPTEPPTADLFGDADVSDLRSSRAGGMAIDTSRAAREQDLLAAVRRQQSAMATQIAMMRDQQIAHVDRVPQQAGAQQQAQLATQQQEMSVPVLSDAEIERRQTILDVAYAKLQAIRKAYSETTTAGQAREQIMVIVNHWRSINQWERSAALAKRYLADNPADIQLPQMRHEVARDYLAWAADAVKPDTPKQELLDEVNRRFTLAREELSGIIAAFPDDQNLKHLAQWDIATSHLSQARVVAVFSSTLARGQFVRAANELLETADLYHDHPKIQELPQMLWNIAQELGSRRFYDEAITVWNEMTLNYPGDPLAEQAAMQIAQTYQNQLRLPLRAVESYLELNFSRGGNDVALQDAIFQIATQLMNEKRWVESLHVLETFVDSFPSHASAGQALTMIGQVHQTNEVWEDAIAAYRRVILEYDQGNWAQQSKWSIAECTINLSRWEEAQGAYREYQKAYPEDPKVAEATSRMEILKDLARFQKVVDEEGQRKAFDAQYQIATIVRTQLANPVKAIIEYRKVAQRWPESHLADDALFQVGMIYMGLGQTEDARDAFLATAESYPTSPLADDALFQVGASFENEAQTLAVVTRGKAVEIAAEMAQKRAYEVSQGNRRVQRAKNLGQIAKLKAEGKRDEADKQTAFQAALNVAFDNANATVVANWASQQEAALTTAQLADRQDKINAALRKAVASFRRAASVASADKADDALLRMAQIYDLRLKDSDAAMETWLEIVKQYSGTTVAEDASWKIAQYYETHEEYADAISAYNSFLRNYRRSPKASDAQAAIAENHEQLGNWVEAMDAYTNYINNYPQGTMANKAKEQIAWIKTYRL